MSYKLATETQVKTLPSTVDGGSISVPLEQTFTVIRGNTGSRNYVYQSKTCSGNTYLKSLLSYGKMLGKKLSVSEESMDKWLYD